MSCKPLAIAFGIVWTVTTASANDSTFGGRGSDLTPLTETRVRMVSERIELVLSESRHAANDDGMAWRVKATYRFHNDSTKQVPLQIGFPESPCSHDEGDCNGTGRFRRMRTTVRGKPVQHRMGRVGDVVVPGGSPDEYPRLGRVFLYDVTFRPDEELEIVHRYTHDRSGSAGVGDTLTYLTRTGASWNGSIGDALFIVRVPFMLRNVLAHRDYPGERLLIRRDGVPKGVELRFHVTDFRPTNDFSLILTPDDGPALTGGTPFEVGGAECPRSASSDVTKVPAATLRLCAAAVEAFYGGPLEVETREALARDLLFDEYREEGYVAVLPHHHPQYDPQWMHASDRRYVQALRRAIGETAAAPLAGSSPATPPRASPPTTPAPDTPPIQPVEPAGCGRCAVAVAGARTEGGPTPLWLFTLLTFLRRRVSACAVQPSGSKIPLQAG